MVPTCGSARRTCTSIAVPLCLLAAVVAHVSGRPPPLEAFRFMKRFGYLEQGPPDMEALYKEEAITDAVKSMQRFGAIPQTGIIDEATVQLMRSPRCGVPDVRREPIGQPGRAKRYVISAPGWKKRNITYFVANWTPKIGEEAVMKYMQLALDSWGRYARLTFTHVRDPNADIIVAFGRGYHGDSYPFDGPGNILAHAYFPYEFGHLGGDIHFDDDENWKVKPADYDEGVDFFTVAVHELGHSLGLGHSPVPSSIMFPYYKGQSKDFALGYDDIMAMYKLYISGPVESDYQPTATTEEPDISDESTVVDDDDVDEDDGVGDSDGDGEQQTTTGTPDDREEATTETATEETTTAAATETFTVTYHGDYETVDEHKEHELPRTTPAAHPDACDGHFDAVAQLRGELFVFKGEYVWRLHTRGVVEPGYPVRIRDFFPKLPGHVRRIDAAYQRNEDGHIVLFSGDHFWVSDGDDFIDSPRPLTDLGLPKVLDKIDAVQQWAKNGKTYLYRNEMFWRYDENAKRMDERYPQHIKRWRGVPQDLDAALTWTDGYTYFFKGNLYWRFDNYLIKTDDHYPLPAPQYWLGCPEKPDTFWWLPPESAGSTGTEEEGTRW